MVRNTFSNEDAKNILHIPLTSVEHDDVCAWCGENSGLFTVRSAYRLFLESNCLEMLVDEHTVTKRFYKKLWSFNLPAKQKIFTWKIYWDYLPTFANLHFRHLKLDALCLQCGRGIKSSVHMFHDCLETKDVWTHLYLDWVLSKPDLDN